MALNLLLKKLVAQTAARNSKRKRDHYLPRASVLDRLSDHDRAAIFDARRRKIEEEVCRTVLDTSDGRARFLKSARDRMKRLERLAQSYGYWLDEPLSIEPCYDSQPPTVPAFLYILMRRSPRPRV